MRAPCDAGRTTEASCCSWRCRQYRCPSWTTRWSRNLLRSPFPLRLADGDDAGKTATSSTARRCRNMCTLDRIGICASSRPAILSSSSSSSFMKCCFVRCNNGFIEAAALSSESRNALPSVAAACEPTPAFPCSTFLRSLSLTLKIVVSSSPSTAASLVSLSFAISLRTTIFSLRNTMSAMPSVRAHFLPALGSGDVHPSSTGSYTISGCRRCRFDPVSSIFIFPPCTSRREASHLFSLSLSLSPSWSHTTSRALGVLGKSEDERGDVVQAIGRCEG